MQRLVPTLGRLAIFLILGTALAHADTFSIEKVKVSNSFDPNSGGQLNLSLLTTSSSKQPPSVVAYFYNAQTGQPLPAAKTSGNPFATSGGQLAAMASLPGFSQPTQYNLDMVIPHWALKINTGGEYIKVRFYFTLKDPYTCEYIKTIKFKLKIENPEFEHERNRRLINLIRQDWRAGLPNEPAIRTDTSGIWNAYTAFGNSLTPSINGRRLATVFQERGRQFHLGGNFQWRHEGSSDRWEELYDRLDIRSGVILPNVQTINPTPIVLGGRNLMIERKKDDILLFSSLPVFRQLFSGRNREEVERRALVLFLTPKLVVENY